MIQYKYKPTFLKDLNKIPKIYKSTLENFIFNKIPKSDDPFSLNVLKKMRGYKNYYKIRFKTYRIGIFFDRDLFEFQRIKHRKDIYKFFP